MTALKDRPAPPISGSAVTPPRQPNLVSESVASELWCPLARVSSPADEPAFNRLAAARVNGQDIEPVYIPRMARCLGLRCMFWRQETRGGLGYCGAAGAP